MWIVLCNKPRIRSGASSFAAGSAAGKQVGALRHAAAAQAHTCSDDLNTNMLMRMGPVHRALCGTLPVEAPRSKSADPSGC